jgi:hypothetical protein
VTASGGPTGPSATVRGVGNFGGGELLILVVLAFGFVAVWMVVVAASLVVLARRREHR